ncbi:hybrid sensor histidine kinase/response regulator [Roseibium sp.]|uniref:ATP-binding response regulator n=1 Tax=Roseibium sp. TaxID=1936156 RepID=UPI003A97C918
MSEDSKSARKLALLAHDLRTPLSAMKLTAELIGIEALSEKQAERLDLLIRSIDALSDLAGDLISGTDEASGERPMSQIVRETVGLYTVAAEAKGLQLILDEGDTSLTLPAGKAGAMRRILTALLDNSVKYTDLGSITVSLSEDDLPDGSGRMMVLGVADTGPGIEKIEQRRLFKPYVRGSAGKARSPGSGLGLWGARQLVAELGGTLELSSEQGAGCRFSILLPYRPVASDAVQSDYPTLRPANAEAHVLVVDDNLTNRRLLSALLESFSISSDQAASGFEALERVAATAYDTVLLDLHMPEMDGLETARRIRELCGFEEMPLIAVTAALETVGDDRLREAGFREVLAKPLSPVDLFQAMGHARDRYRKRMDPGT